MINIVDSRQASYITFESSKNRIWHTTFRVITNPVVIQYGSDFIISKATDEKSPLQLKKSPFLAERLIVTRSNCVGTVHFNRIRAVKVQNRKKFKI